MKRFFLSLLAAGAVALPYASVQAMAAPPDKIPAVAKATAERGWPHAATPAERAGVKRVIKLAFVPPTMTALTRCNDLGTIAFSKCVTTVVTYGTPSPAGGLRPALVLGIFRVNVKVWEDGSFRFLNYRRVR